mmetsp:Transcript_69612/g.167029  ORF Transcript_69612/g.167029 Transcript_69612/m.167029 type:complete len:942 (+) Transcript_69612:102-2927(+)
MSGSLLEHVPTRGVIGILFGIFLVDIGICLVLHFLNPEAHRSSGFRGGTTDTLLFCGTRVILFPFMTWVAQYAYHRIERHSPLIKHQRELEASSSSAESVLESGSGAGVSLPVVGGSAGTNGLATPLVQVQGRDICPTATRPVDTFKIKEEHALLMKKATNHRNYVLSVFFCIATAMSVYNGLKCVSFAYVRDLKFLEGALLSAVLILINAEYFLMRDFVGKISKEQGELLKGIHMHPLFFETGLKCHGCDICSEQMKGPHYIAYRCRTCDFDLCPRCYKLKDKPTFKGTGARGIRKDTEQLTSWSYFQRIIKEGMEFRRPMILAIVCLVASQTMQIAAPSVQGSIFDGILSYVKDPNGGNHRFENAMITYLLVNILQGFFGGLKALGVDLVLRHLACSMRNKLFGSIIRMDIAFFDGMHTGQLTSRLTNDVSQMVSPLSTLLNDLLANLMLLVGGMVMAFHTSWKLSILALTVVPPITFIYRLYAEWARKVNRNIYCAYGEANSTATEAIHNIRTVRGFSTEAFETCKYEDSIDTALGHAKLNAYVGASVNASSTYLNLGTAVLILWYGGDLVIQGVRDPENSSMTLGMLITFQLYWNMMNNAFIALGNVFNDLIRSSSAAERVFSLIDCRPDIDPDAGMVLEREQIHGHLELKGVEFRYRTRPDNLVLRGVNLTMSPGTTTALVGKSGGGKSTLVHLLMRFYEPTSGSILLDGRDTRDLSSRSVRRFCGFVAQDTQLFATSVVDNLTYGLGNAVPHEEVVAATEAANAHEFITEMEEGYETRCGERGVMMSGGQRQRLAIARCFLRHPKLLFLDEATSALDAENEALVQKALEKLIEQTGCTVVLIAHRLSTVINATQIAVIHKGNVIERGNHDELQSKAGIYAALVKRQLDQGAASQLEKHDKNNDGKKGGQLRRIDDIFEEMEQSGTFNLSAPELTS